MLRAARLSMKKSYTPRPEVPKEILERYQAILYALTAQWTVSEAAEKVGIARNHFQTLMHRAMAGMVEASPERETERRRRAEGDAAVTAGAHRYLCDAHPEVFGGLAGPRIQGIGGL
jgi:hypothetical protein